MTDSSSRQSNQSKPTLVQEQAARMGVSIAKRAPGSARIMERYLSGALVLGNLNSLYYSLGGSVDTSWQRNIFYALLGSDLWKDLDPTYGRCDGMVSGKYHRARLFSFDEPDFFVLCVTETGDRGTSWSYVPKEHVNPTAVPKIPNFETFIESLCMGLCLARPELVHVYADAGVPAIVALREARRIESGLAGDESGPRIPRPRL